MVSQVGKFILILGVIFVILGLILWLGSRWIPLGKLPGDFVFHGKNITIYFPFMSGLLISLALSGLFQFIQWLLRK